MVIDDTQDNTAGIVGGLAPVMPLTPSQPKPNKPEDRTIDEAYSGLRQEQLGQLRTPMSQFVDPPEDSIFSQSNWAESKEYKQEKDYITTMLSDPDNLGGVAPNIVSASLTHPDGQQLKDTAVALRATAFMLNRRVDDLDPSQLPVYMKGVAAQLGQQAPKNVTGYRNMLARHFVGMQQREDAFTDLTQKLVSDQLFSAQNQEQTLATKDVGQTLSSWFEAHPEIAADPSKHWLIARSANEFSQRMLKELAPVKAPAAQTFDTLVRFTKGNSTPEELASLSMSLQQLTPEDRQKVYQFTSIAAAANQINRSALAQFAVNMGQSFSRGFDFVPQGELMNKESGVASTIDAIKKGTNVWVLKEGDKTQTIVSNEHPDTGYEDILQSDWKLATPEERQKTLAAAEQRLQGFQIERELRNLAKSSVDPIRQLSNGGLMGAVERGAYGLSGSIPLMGVIAIPYVGEFAGVAAYQAQEYDRIRLTNPDMSLGAAQGLALIEGAGNAAIDRLQLSALAGKSTFFAKTLQEMKAGGIVNYLKRAGVMQGEQFMQENLQDAIAPIVEGIASAIRQDMPNTDFAADMREYLNTRPEVFFAVLPLALVGGGFAEIDAIKNPAATFTREAMRMAGFNDQSIEYVFSAPDKAQLQTRLQEEWKKRKPEDISKGIDIAEQRAESAKTYESPYSLAIDEQANGDSVFVVTDKRDGTEVIRTPDLDAAWEIMGQRQAADLSNERQAIRELFDWSKKILRDPKITLDAAPQMVKMLKEQFEKKGDKQALQELRNRLVDAGFDPDGDLTGIGVFGETSIEQVRDAVYRAVITLNKDANLLDAFEEIGHGFDRVAVAEGRVSIDQFAKWLEQTEQTTGKKFNRGNETEILESMARLRQDWVSGKIEDTSLPSSVLAYLKKLALVLQDAILRFSKIQAAMESGQIDKSLGEYLDESLGISPQSKMDTIAEREAAALVGTPSGRSYSVRQSTEITPAPTDEKGIEIPESVDKAALLEDLFVLASSKKWRQGRDLKVAMQEALRARFAEAKLPFPKIPIPSESVAESPEATKYLVRVGVRDALLALRQNANAIGWYDIKTRQALAVMALVHPEIATDENARFAMTWAMAVTSNGLKVGKNFQLAEEAYSIFKKTGKMPTDIGVGKAQNAINNGLGLYNKLSEEWGVNNMRLFMQTHFKVEEISALSTDLTPSGEHAATNVRGAAILGPKIGNGFYSNLYGYFDALTMDRWLIRTWGRWTGTLLDDNEDKIAEKRPEMLLAFAAMPEQSRIQLVEKLRGLTKTTKTKGETPLKPGDRERLISAMEDVAKIIASNKVLSDAIAQTLANEKPDASVLGDLINSRPEKEAAKVLSSLEELANAIAKASAEPKFREAMNSVERGEKVRTTGNNLQGYLDAQKEDPEGPHERNYIRHVFGQILAQLQQMPDYADLTMADLQAVLWYSEKRLYETAKQKVDGQQEENDTTEEEDEDTSVEGYEDEEAPDYANAAVEVARSKRVSESKIQKALTDEQKRTGTAQRVAQGQPGTGTGVQANAGGFTQSKKRLFIGSVAVRRVRLGRRTSEAASYSYGREDRADGKRLRSLKDLGVQYTTRWKAGTALKRIFRANLQKGDEDVAPEFFELVSDDASAAKFSELLTQSKNISPFGAAVYVYPTDRYKSMRLFVTKDGKAGFAIKQDNDIVSVFSMGNAGRAVLEVAVAAGGRKLDAFDTILPHYYSAHGFVAVSRLKWQDKFMPDGWDKNTFKDFNNGEPDVVFMVHDPEYRGWYSEQDGEVATNYKKAAKIQTDALATRSSYSLKRANVGDGEPPVKLWDNATAREALLEIPSTSKFYKIAQQMAALPHKQLDTDRVKNTNRSRAARRSDALILVGREGETPRTIVHEVAHSLTSDALDKYLGQWTGTRNAYFNLLQQKSGDPLVPRPIRDLIGLYLDTLEVLGVTDVFAYGGKRKIKLGGTPMGFSFVGYEENGETKFYLKPKQWDKKQGKYAPFKKFIVENNLPMPMEEKFDEEKTTWSGGKIITYKKREYWTQEQMEQIFDAMQSKGLSADKYVDPNSAPGSKPYRYNFADFFSPEVTKTKTFQPIAGGDNPDITVKGGLDAQLFNKETNKFLGRSELYGLGNLDEFIAQAFSSTDFQEMLASIPGDKQGRSLWQKFMDAVQEFLSEVFGIEIKDTMLESVLRVSSQIANLEVPPRYDRAGNPINRQEGTSYSIRKVDESGIEQSLEVLNRAPEERLALYDRAKQRLLDVVRRNSEIIENAIEDGATPEATRRLQLQQAIAELEGIFRILPKEMRNRVGGFARLANIAPMDVYKDGTKISEAKNRAGAFISAWMREGDSIGVAMRRTELPPGYTMQENFDTGRTDQALAQFFKERVGIIDRQLERLLRREYDIELQKVWQRSKPKKNQPGERPKGIGAEIQRMFAELKGIAELSEDETRTRVSAMQDLIDTGDLSPADEAYQRQLMGLANLVGNWKEADASRRASAVKALRDTWSAAYANFKVQLIREAARLQDMMEMATIATGKWGDDYFGRKAKSRKAQKGWGRFNSLMSNVVSWDGLMRLMFGDQSPIAQQFSDMQRKADNDKEDGVQNALQEIEDLFVSITGDRAKGEQLRYEMMQPTVKTQKGELSQLEAITATMMWMQEDGKRHMIGHLDEDGKPSGSWNYEQDWVDEVEKQLTPEARKLRLFLLEKYRTGWYPLNEVYKTINGVDLPQITNYSPMSLTPKKVPANTTVDVSGQPIGGGVNFGNLMNRGTAIAEPDFKDALQIYIAHTKSAQHFMAYAPFMHEVGKVLKNRTVQNAIAEAIGPEAPTVLNTWLTSLAQGGNRDASLGLEFSKVGSDMLGRATQMALVGRIGTLFVQTTQLAAASAEIPTGAYIVRLSKLLTGNLGWGAALNSKYIQRRIKQLPPVVQEAMRGLAGDKPNAIKRTVRILGDTISGVDGLFTAGTFAILYDYHLNQAEKVLGMARKQAEEYAEETAERITDRLAQPTRMGAKSIIEVTNTNPAWRVAFAFASEPRKNLALLAYALAKRPVATKLRTLGYLLLGNALFSAVIRNAWRDARDKDDDEWFDEKNWSVKRLLVTALSDPLMGIPVFGEALQEGVYRMTGEYYNNTDLLSIGRGVTALGHIPDTLAGDRDMDQILGDLNAILAMGGLFNQNIAAITSLSTVAKDVWGTGENTVKMATE